MKALKSTLLMLTAGLFLASCTHRIHTHKPHPVTGGLPPGQAKKVAGTKSAKPFAPGQQKKKNH